MAIKVRIVQLGRGVFQYSGEPGATVGMGLDAAEVSAAGMELRVNGAPAGRERPLADGDLVTVIPRIRGGATGCTAATAPAGAGCGRRPPAAALRSPFGRPLR